MSFAHVSITPGETDARHRHPNCDEILHVVAGQVEQSLDDESFILEAGDTISIPAGVWHHTTVLGQEDVQLICCYSSSERQVEFDPSAHVVHQRSVVSC